MCLPFLYDYNLGYLEGFSVVLVLSPLGKSFADTAKITGDFPEVNPRMCEQAIPGRFPLPRTIGLDRGYHRPSIRRSRVLGFSRVLHGRDDRKYISIVLTPQK